MKINYKFNMNIPDYKTEIGNLGVGIEVRHNLYNGLISVAF